MCSYNEAMEEKKDDDSGGIPGVGNADGAGTAVGARRRRGEPSQSTLDALVGMMPPHPHVPVSNRESTASNSSGDGDGDVDGDSDGDSDGDGDGSKVAARQRQRDPPTAGQNVARMMPPHPHASTSNRESTANSSGNGDGDGDGDDVDAAARRRPRVPPAAGLDAATSSGAGGSSADDETDPGHVGFDPLRTPTYLHLPPGFRPTWTDLLPPPPPPPPPQPEPPRPDAVAGAAVGRPCRPARVYNPSYALSLLSVLTFTVTAAPHPFDATPPEELQPPLEDKFRDRLESICAKSNAGPDAGGNGGSSSNKAGEAGQGPPLPSPSLYPPLSFKDGKWRIPLSAYHPFRAYLAHAKGRSCTEGIPEERLKVATLGRERMGRSCRSVADLQWRGVPPGLANALAPYQRAGVNFTRGTLDEVLWNLIKRKYRDLGEFVEGREGTGIAVHVRRNGGKSSVAEIAEGGACENLVGTGGGDDGKTTPGANILEGKIEALGKEEAAMLLAASGNNSKLDDADDTAGLSHPALAALCRVQ